jgi:two-component sensor histidine kinase
LWIGFHEIGPNAYGLTVRDNGIGLPQGIRLDQTNSLGLRLVNTLVRQLNGEVHFEGNGGTRFDIAFKLSPRGGNR